MIQRYRLSKPANIQLETNEDFQILFGKPLELTMKKSDIPITLLYSHRTDYELINIEEIHYIFRKSIVEVLFRQGSAQIDMRPKQSISSYYQF